MSVDRRIMWRIRSRKILLLVVFGALGTAAGFSPVSLATIQRRGFSTTLYMAKQLRNKQAALAQKMALAREQKAKKEGLEPGKTGSGERRMSDKDIKEKNDRLRFEELLKTQSTSLNAVSSDGYLTKEQEEAEIDAYQRGLDLLFEGDPAPTQPFEGLVNIKSENDIGDTGVKRMLPWLRNGSSDFLIIVCDPRVQSPELRETVRSLNAELPKEWLSKTVIINADTPAENRRWMKKSGLSNVNVYSDEKREWMRSYTALGEERWSISMFVIADERLQKVAREMETVTAIKAIGNAVKAMEDRRL